MTNKYHNEQVPGVDNPEACKTPKLPGKELASNKNTSGLPAEGDTTKG